MKQVLYVLIVSYLGSFLLARAETANPFDLTCRSQAKEIAVQTYQSCVSTARKQRVEEIRKEYQSKMSELKSHYDGELKKLAPGAKAGAKASVAAKGKKSSKLSTGDARPSGVTSTLPQKKIQSGQTLPVQNLPEASATTDMEIHTTESTTVEVSSPANEVEPEAQTE